MTDIHTCRFGVNYTPSKDWWYCWNDFDAESLARDLDTIAALGADHIRIMTLWHFFQPNPAWVSPAHLERLGQVMGLAGARGLDVCVALLNGHLTGQNFRQGYERPGSSFFSDPALIAAQRLYIEQVATVTRACPNFLGFDLGNELNCCWRTDDIDEGDRWFLESMDALEAAAPGRVHVNGVNHGPWFFPDTFSPRCLATRHAIVPLHSWIYFTEALQRGGPDSPPVVRLIEGMAALARAFADDPHKPIWVQEYGASEEWMAAEAIPAFFERTTLTAIEAGVAWFTVWASHDIDPKFAVNPLEYTLGLITCDQRIKPQGEVFREIATAHRGGAATPPAAVPAPPAAHTQDATWAWLLQYMDDHPAQ